ASKARPPAPAHCAPATPRTSSCSSPLTSELTGMTDILDAGESLLIFPEGTGGPGDQVATFQAGLYRLAKHAPKVPVVPVTLKNLSRILPKGETIPVPHLSQVIVHKPLFVGIDEPQDDFLSRARNILANELIAEGDSQ